MAGRILGDIKKILAGERHLARYSYHPPSTIERLSHDDDDEAG